jgi:preprotein translocase subunit SecE
MTKHNKEKKRARLAQLIEEGGGSATDANNVLDSASLTPGAKASQPKAKPKVKKSGDSWLRVFFAMIKAIFVRPKGGQTKKRVEAKPPGRIKKLFYFFRDARKELHWVTWPTRKETIKSTGVLLALVGVSALYLGIVDGILTRLLGLLVN